MQQSLSDRLAFLRIQNGFSKEELANKVGVSPEMIAQWEIGTLTPDVQEVLTLSNIYGVSVDDILRSQVRVNDLPKNVYETPQQNTYNPQQNQYGNASQTNYSAPPQGNAYNVPPQGNAYNVPPQGNYYNAPPQGNAYNASQQWNNEDINAQANDFVKKLFRKGFRLFNRELSPATARLMFVFPFPLVVVAVYLFAGTVLHLWHPAWILFLLIPCYYMIAASFKAKSLKSFLFLMPVPIVIVMLFLIFGFMFRIWHPTWMLFLIIPVYYWSVAVFVRKRRW